MSLDKYNAELARALGVSSLAGVRQVTLTIRPGESPRVHVDPGAATVLPPGSATSSAARQIAQATASFKPEAPAAAALAPAPVPAPEPSPPTPEPRAGLFRSKKSQ